MKLNHLAILIMCAGNAFAQLPTQKVLTVDLAQTIAQEAMMKCRADGYKVSVTVVDHTNLLKAFLRDDGAPMGTINAMGGVPIKAGDQLVGAVSVSGAPGGDKDAACANAALAKVADKLK